MIRMLIVDEKTEETDMLCTSAKQQAALMTEEEWRIEVIKDREAEEKQGPWDIAFLDITGEKGIETAEKLRKRYRDVYLVLIVSQEQSPLLYLKPTILAASVLMRPFIQDTVQNSIREAIFWISMLDRRQKDIFIISGREGKIRIPYGRILYFEARAKKIYAALETEEYGFYDSMDHLEENLPGWFIRCHRSFIVNMHYLEKLQPNSGACLLRGEIEVPVSRSYRSNIRRYF